MTGPVTSRERIRAELERGFRDWPVPHTFDEWAARIDEALFGPHDDPHDERTIAGLAWEVERLREHLREKNEIIKAYAGPTGMTPEDVAFALIELARLRASIALRKAVAADG